MNIRIATSIVALPTLLAGSAQAADLRIGDTAPPVSLGNILRAGELTEDQRTTGQVTFGDGRVYVLDFWATWCGPCLASFPESTEIQQRLADRDVVFLAVTDEDPHLAVELMLRDHPKADRFSDVMGFAVAADPDKTTHDAYLKAAEIRGIPTAFIVGGEGTLEWIGNPLADPIERTIESVLDGEWDRVAYRDRYEGERSRQQRFEAALQEDDFEAAAELAGDDWVKLNRVAFGMAYRAEAGDTEALDRAAQLAERVLELTDEKEGFAFHALGIVRFKQGDVEEAIRLAERAIALNVDGRGGQYYEQALEQYKAALAGEE